MDYAIGIDLGGSSVKAVAITPDGEILQRVNEEFDVGEQLSFAETITAVFQRIQEKQGSAAMSCGVAAPGLASKDHFSIAHMPGRLHGLEGLNWTEFLGTKSPGSNDAHAALRGEAWRGAARGRGGGTMLTRGAAGGGGGIEEARLVEA